MRRRSATSRLKSLTPSPHIRHDRVFLRLCHALCFLLIVTVGRASAHEAPPRVTVLVAYHSGSGHTEKLAHGVVEGAESLPGTRVLLRRVGQVTAEELFAADALVLGSPVYWSNMAAEVKAFIDSWQFKFGVWPDLKLKNKVGAVFTTGGQVSGGKELTMLSMLAAMLGNQMIVVSGGGAFGASATTEGDSPGIDERELSAARDLGRRVAEVAVLVTGRSSP